MTTLQTQSVAQWQIDPVHSEIGFSTRHLMVTNVKGRFQQYAADLELDEANPINSSVNVEIDVASIDTRTDARDQHLRSADFFDAENHPKIRFQSKRIEANGADRYRVIGDLTIRGTTGEVVLDAELSGPVTDPWGGERVGVTASTKIDRRDYGLVWNQVLETGGLTVGNDVKITIELQFTKSE